MRHISHWMRGICTGVVPSNVPTLGVLDNCEKNVRPLKSTGVLFLLTGMVPVEKVTLFMVLYDF